MQWWNQDNKRTWIFEQIGIPMPLLEWIFLGVEGRKQFQLKGNYVYKSLMKIWHMYTGLLSLYQLPIMSFFTIQNLRRLKDAHIFLSGDKKDGSIFINCPWGLVGRL